MTHIDKCLDKYAGKAFGDHDGYTWWWNGDNVLSAAISSACKHLRNDGSALYDKSERKQLKTLGRYMGWYADHRASEMLPREQQSWLHAEAMWLLGLWFSRLWD